MGILVNKIKPLIGKIFGTADKVRCGNPSIFTSYAIDVHSCDVEEFIVELINGVYLIGICHLFPCLWTNSFNTSGLASGLGTVCFLY